jgi:hypothetical protein
MSELRNKWETRTNAIAAFQKATRDIISVFCEFSYNDEEREIFKIDIKGILETIPFGLMK